jgi:hypothetical protein
VKWAQTCTPGEALSCCRRSFSRPAAICSRADKTAAPIRESVPCATDDSLLLGLCVTLLDPWRFANASRIAQSASTILNTDWHLS